MTNIVLYAAALSFFTASFYVATTNMQKEQLKCAGQYPEDVSPEYVQERYWKSLLKTAPSKIFSNFGFTYVTFGQSTRIIASFHNSILIFSDVTNCSNNNRCVTKKIHLCLFSKTLQIYDKNIHICSSTRQSIQPASWSSA
jgi:hypothetical protein